MRNLFKISVIGFLSFCFGSTCAELEEAPAIAPPQNSPSLLSSSIPSYVLGVRVRINDLSDASATGKLLPLVGLRYGRWKIGTNADIDEWLSFSSFRKEPTASFDLTQSDRIKTALSIRIQNLKTGESFDFIESGRKTVRGRGLLNYKLDATSFIGLELTQDLLNRGDGTTLSLGASKSFRLSESAVFSLNSGLTWGNASHWRAGNAAGTPAGNLGAGLGAVGVGSSLRYSITPSWAWYTTLGAGRSIGEVGQVVGSQWRFSGQMGLMYFGKF